MKTEKYTCYECGKKFRIRGLHFIKENVLCTICYRKHMEIIPDNRKDKLNMSILEDYKK